jgi:hypothetical protein
MTLRAWRRYTLYNYYAQIKGEQFCVMYSKSAIENPHFVAYSSVAIRDDGMLSLH